VLAVSRSVPVPVLLPRSQCQRVRFSIRDQKKRPRPFDAAILRMLKNLQQTFVLLVQAKTGVSGGLFVWLGSACTAAVFAFVFLCVAGYAWSSIKLGPVFGGLAMAGVFLLIAIIGAAASVLSRQRTKQRAVLERAESTRPTAALVNPRMLNAAMQAGRALGWQRLLPLALLAFLTVQWAQQARRQNEGGEEA
jgi:hypothetical protein